MVVPGLKETHTVEDRQCLSSKTKQVLGLVRQPMHSSRLKSISGESTHILACCSPADPITTYRLARATVPVLSSHAFPKKGKWNGTMKMHASVFLPTSSLHSCWAAGSVGRTLYRRKCKATSLHLGREVRAPILSACYFTG